MIEVDSGDQMRAAVILIVFVFFCSGLAHAQAWTPQKNVEIVVPVAPGGTNDKLARAIERTMTTGKLLSSSITVVHKPGGGNQIGYAYVNQHAGDPHILLIGTATLLTAHITGQSKVHYTDFTPIASIFNDYLVLTVNVASPVKSGKDLVARMRTDAQNTTLGFSAAVGNHHHIAAGLFMRSIGAPVRDLKPVIFKGSSEALIALMGGHIQLVSTGAGNAVPHATSGKLRIVGVSATQRLPGAMADVPTWKEQGVNLDYGSWRTILAPKGLSPEQVAYWERILRQVTEAPDWKAELERYFWGNYFFTGPTLRKNLDKEYADSKAVLVELGLAKQ
jgi:putative tricarboxylic transport membrane protein